jgi:hypothetical protein
MICNELMANCITTLQGKDLKSTLDNFKDNLLKPIESLAQRINGYAVTTSMLTEVRPKEFL